MNEVAEYDWAGSRSRTYVHGISYVDERLIMKSDQTNRPYYYAVNRMYDVVMLIDRAGAIVERYCYDAYGRPYIRESCGRGDMNDNTVMSSTDTARFTAALSGAIWDPRADLDDDGDVDGDDQTLYNAKYTDWSGPAPPVTVAQAFSDVGNPYMFQGVPHFALDTPANATSGKLMLNHHRARFEDVAIGRWVTSDPREYDTFVTPRRQGISLAHLLIRFPRSGHPRDAHLYIFLDSNAVAFSDASGLEPVQILDRYRCGTCGSCLSASLCVGVEPGDQVPGMPGRRCIALLQNCDTVTSPCDEDPPGAGVVYVYRTHVSCCGISCR